MITFVFMSTGIVFGFFALINQLLIYCMNMCQCVSLSTEREIIINHVYLKENYIAIALYCIVMKN